MSKIIAHESAFTGKIYVHHPNPTFYRPLNLKFNIDDHLIFFLSILLLIGFYFTVIQTVRTPTYATAENMRLQVTVGFR